MNYLESRAIRTFQLIRNEDFQVLSLRRLPARLTAAQTACILGFETHHIPIVIGVKNRLKPLGKPRVNAVRYFAARLVLQLAEDDDWLSKATDAVYEFNERQKEIRAQRKRHGKDPSTNGEATN